jgi:TolB-like protein
MKGILRLLEQAQRRGVFRVMAAYAVVAWVAIEVTSVIAPALDMPPWILRSLIVLLAAGFTMLLLLAGARELTRGGVWRMRPPTPAAGAAATGTAELRPATRRNAALGFAGLAAALLVVAAVGFNYWYAADGSHSPRASGDGTAERRVAIMPFAVQGSDRLAYLGHGLVHLLSTGLDGVGDLVTADPHALIARAAIPPGTALDPGTARRLARELGAALFVLGSVVELGGRMEISATLYEAGSGARLRTESVIGEEDRLQDVVTDLARRLIADLAGARGDRLTPLAARTTSSLDALRAYLAGQSAWDRADFMAAMSSFRRAVELDSTFTLAWYRLAAAAAWQVDGPTAREAASAALAGARTLSSRDRRMVSALHAFVNGHAADAEHHYQRLLAEDPADLEAAYMLGEIAWHYGPLRGRDMDLAWPWFARLGTSWEAIIHLAVLAGRRGDAQTVDSLARAAEALSLSPTYASFLAPIPVLVRRDDAGVDSLAAALAALGHMDVLLAPWTAVVPFQQPARAGPLVQTLTLAHRPRGARAYAHGVLAFLAAAQMQWTQAEDQLRALGPLHAPTAVLHRSFLVQLPGAPFDSAVLESARRELEEWDATQSLPSDGVYVLLPAELQPTVREYLLGLLEYRLGRPEDMLRRARELESRAAADSATARSLGRALQARARLQLGDPHGALRILEAEPLHAFYDQMFLSPVLSRVADRFLMATLLEATGRGDDAMGWYEAMGDISVYDVAYAAAAQRRLAAIHGAAGRHTEAARHHARVRDLAAVHTAPVRPDPSVGGRHQEP